MSQSLISDPQQETLSVKKPLNSTREPEIELAVKDYLAGNTLAFARLEKYLSDVIQNVIHTKRYPGYKDHLEDLTQECWVDAIRNLSNWNPERGTLKNFLFKCFANRLMVYLYKISPLCQSVPLHEVETSLRVDIKKASLPNLKIHLKVRFLSKMDQRVVQIVGLYTMLRVFDKRRNKTIQALRDDTGLSLRRIRFLIHYTMVIIRKHCMEVEWRSENWVMS